MELIFFSLFFSFYQLGLMAGSRYVMREVRFIDLHNTLKTIINSIEIKTETIRSSTPQNV